MSSVKRKSSRSPEGSSHQRKALRNDSISTSNDSRKNSNANAHIANASADPRSRQNRGSAATVRSPVSTDGSTYQDAASSRSTPRPANIKPSTIATSHESNETEADDAETNPLLDPLSTLLNLVRAESAVQVSQKLAKIQLAAATSEFHNMKHNFPKFPSIEERMKKGKFTADQEVAKLEDQLKINADAQPGLAKSLAAAFLDISSRAEERRVPKVSPEAVTRQEFKELQDGFAKQQSMLEKQQDQFAKQQDLVDKQQKLIEKLQSSHAESRNTALQAREQANTTERGMIKDLEEQENKLQIIQASVHSSVERVREEMQLQLDNVVQDANRARTAAERHETAITQTTEKLEAQSRVVNQLSITIDAATNTVSDAQKGLTKLEERLTATKNEVGQIGANEQRVIAQRLREYDQKLNDLRTLVESLRSESAHLQDELVAQKAQKAEDAPNPVILAKSDGKAAARADSEALMARVEAAIAHLRSEMNDNADARDEVIGGAQDEQEAELARTKEQLGSLAQKVETLEKQADACSSGIQRLQRTTDEKHAQTGVAYESVRDTLKVIQGTYATLQEKTTSLSENIAALEKRPVAVAAAPMPAPSGIADAVQFRPVAAQSPRGSGSRSGSTSGQANGVHSPRNPASPFGGGFANGAPLPREIDVLSNQIQGMAGTVRNLKQRMDNLTTEEVFRGMADQFMSTFPGAKEFQAIVDALKAMDANLEARLEASDSNVNMLHGNQTELRGKVDELANRVFEGQVRTSDVEEEVKVLRKDVETSMADARKDFDAAMGLQTDAIIDIRHQVRGFADNAFGPSDEP
jgi:chromosome segregation ATPase